jgi:hypothetical protein
MFRSLVSASDLHDPCCGGVSRRMYTRYLGMIRQLSGLPSYRQRRSRANQCHLLLQVVSSTSSLHSVLSAWTLHISYLPTPSCQPAYTPVCVTIPSVSNSHPTAGSARSANASGASSAISSLNTLLSIWQPVPILLGACVVAFSVPFGLGL